MVYDSVRKVVVLFGGTYQFGPWIGDYDDTWIWDGRNWTEQRLPVRPIKRTGAAVVHDLARDRIVMFGSTVYGSVVRPDTWEWDGQRWAERQPQQSPAAMFAPVMHYDARRERVVLLTARPNATSLVTETWIYQTAMPASLSDYGASCSVARPRLIADRRPWLGDQVQLTMGVAPTVRSALLFVGRSRTVWGGKSLPISLGFLGMPGCRLLTSPDVPVFGALVGTRATWSLQVPSLPSLVGRTLFAQAALADATVNAGGVAWSQGLALSVGRR